MTSQPLYRRCSRRCRVVLVVGLVASVALALLVDQAVRRHEQQVVRDQAENVAGAVRAIGEPIVDAVATAVVQARSPEGVEGFSAQMDPLIGTYPLVRSIAIVEQCGEQLCVLAHSGAQPTGFDPLTGVIPPTRGELEGAVEALNQDDDVIIFAGMFPVPGVTGRAVYGELAIYREWLQLLAQDTARNIHLRYTLETPGRPPTELLVTGGMPSGAAYVEMVDFGGSELKIEAIAVASTIGRAEQLAPLIAGLVALLFTALAVSIFHAIDRRGEEVARLSVETERLDAALEERLRIEEELAHRAYHDLLTGLPNRAWLIERLQNTDLPRPSAIFFIDLDGFKVVNDSLGHEVGDQLLRVIAERLETVVDDEIITRFGGDEFVIIGFRTADDHYIDDLSGSLRAAVSPALDTEDGEVFVTASIGIRRVEPGIAPEELLRDADAAMYAAKDFGRDRHIVFQPAVRDRAVERLHLDTGLRQALESDQLHMRYQPIVDLGSGALVGAEALLRWQHPERGLLLPNEFLPILTHTTLLGDLDDFVLRTAAAQQRVWLDQGLDIRLAVNLSATSVDRADLVDFVGAVVDQHQLPRQSLAIELTEKRLVDIADREWIQQLRSVGVAVGIDDFGTGYTSIAYLRDLPVDFLKLDQSFVEPLGRDHKTATIVRTLLALAVELGITTVAEGIETDEQADMLRDYGCQFGQGTLFSSPLEPEELPRQPTAQLTP